MASTTELTEDVPARLRRLAAVEGRSEADVARDAIDAYERSLPAIRSFALDGCVEGDGTSAADIPEEEYLKGFGER